LSDYLLDASAMLAILLDEPGADKVEALIENAAIHAVQLAEIIKKLKDNGASDEVAEQTVASLGLPVIEHFSSDQARRTSKYCRKGLSLGDRACLSIAEELNYIAVTADRQWQHVAEDPACKVRVLLIR